MALDSPTHGLYEWQIPSRDAAPDRIIGFLNESVEEGQAWLKSQRGYADIRRSLDVLAGKDPIARQATYRSQMNPNPLKRNVREVVGTLAKLRPMWGYHSDNSAYKSQAEMFNKVSKAWYLESFADRAVREALQYASASCRGWIFPIYRRDMFGTGRGDIKLLTYGSPCVLPVQLPSSGDWQSAYIVNRLEEMPVAMAHGMFPKFQHELRPTSSRYWYMNDGVRRASQGNILRRMFGTGNARAADAKDMSELLVPIRYSYVIDLSINKSSRPVPMGEPGSSWAYIVPYVGQLLPSGERATENDARLYPRRRLLISTDKTLLYDGPSFDWHGMMPGVSFCVDDWAWEPLGFSLIHDGYEINEGIKDIVRGNMDKMSAQLRPSMMFDINATSMKEARTFDPYKPNDRIGYDGSAISGKPFDFAIPPELLKLQPESFTMLEYLEGALRSQHAINDVQALAKMRAVGSMDELEKIMEAAGPIVEDISRSMEPPMRDLGVMVKYLIMQYYTTARIMQYVGPDGVTPEVFDYDPTKVVPSHLPGENPDGGPSKYSVQERAKIFADNLRFFILPNSLHEYTQMAVKLGLIQLRKSGVMIDSQTIAEAWQVPNYGNIDGNTVIDRWEREQEMQLEVAARAKELGTTLGLLPPPGAAAPAKGKQNPEGRPPSGQAAPALASKDGGSRSTITESK